MTPTPTEEGRNGITTHSASSSSRSGRCRIRLGIQSRLAGMVRTVVSVSSALASLCRLCTSEVDSCHTTTSKFTEKVKERKLRQKQWIKLNTYQQHATADCCHLLQNLSILRRVSSSDSRSAFVVFQTWLPRVEIFAFNFRVKIRKIWTDNLI